MLEKVVEKPTIFSIVARFFIKKRWLKLTLFYYELTFL